MERPAAYLTISVDDGATTDMRLADLLADLGLAGTFYIPARNAERPVLGDSEIRELSRRFEVGAHTFHHTPLPGLPAAECRREIADGKEWLENVVGHPVDAFCYPRGKFNRQTAGLVAEAGFIGARTCMQNLVGAPVDPFRWGVSTHAYSHSRTIQVRHALLEGNWRGLSNFLTLFRTNTDWKKHFAQATRHVVEHGGVAHLQLHSWEIDQNDDWSPLHEVLTRVLAEGQLSPVTNGQLFRDAEMDSQILASQN